MTQHRDFGDSDRHFNEWIRFSGDENDDEYLDSTLRLLL